MGKPSVTLLRRVTQLVFFLLFVYGALIFKQELRTGPVLPAIEAPEGMPSTSSFRKGTILWASDDPPVIDAYLPGATCRYNPKGGLVKACIVHMVSENLTWRTRIPYILPHLLIFIVASFLVGRWWCGWVCPLGTIGDLFSSARKMFRFHYVEFSRRMQRILKGTSHFLLWGGWATSWLIGLESLKSLRCHLFLPYCQLCPARLLCPMFGLAAPSWRDFTNAFTTTFTVLAWGTLAIFLGAFVVGRRLWCRVCPIGLVTSWFNRGSLLQLNKNPEQCNRCGSCADSCPMANTHIREEKKEQINHPDCIFCLRCVEQCPREKCLSLRFLKINLLRSSLKT